MVNFKDDIIKNYMDKNGLVTIDRNPGIDSTGNGLLHTGLFYWCLFKQGNISLDDVNRFIRAVDLCSVRPGIYKRSPDKTDMESYDDYIGICAASLKLNTNHRFDVVNHGKSHIWCFNNQNPDKFSLVAWHWRFLGVISFYHHCCGQYKYMFKLMRFIVSCLVQPSLPKILITEVWNKPFIKRYFGDNHPFSSLNNYGISDS